MVHSTGILPSGESLNLWVCFGAEVAVFVDAAGEEVLHQAGLDALLLGNQRLGLFNRPVHGREDFGDFGLLIGFGNWEFEFFKNILVKMLNGRTCQIVFEKFMK